MASDGSDPCSETAPEGLPSPGGQGGLGGSGYEMISALLTQQLEAAFAQHAAIEADRDPEALHAYRVALRRARALLSLAGSVYAKADRRELAQHLQLWARATGPLRDLDVWLAQRQWQIESLPVELRDAGTDLFERLATERMRLHAAVVEHLKRGTYREAAARTQASLEARRLDFGPRALEGDFALAVQVLRKRYRAVRRQVKKLGPEADESAVHRLRIACKKLRYGLELFAPFRPGDKALERLVKRLKRLQDDLGAFNDGCTQRQWLLSHPAAWDERTLCLAAGALAGMHETRVRQQRARVLTHAQSLRDSGLARRVKSVLAER